MPQPMGQQSPAVTVLLPRPRRDMLLSQMALACCMQPMDMHHWMVGCLAAGWQGNGAGYCHASERCSQGPQQQASEAGQLFTAVSRYSCTCMLLFLFLSVSFMSRCCCCFSHCLRKSSFIFLYIFFHLM